MKKYDIILFDVDGTLLDFHAAQENALKMAFEKHNYELNDNVKTIYDEINHSLWNQYEQGKITKEEVIYTRFVTLFARLGLEGDGVAFEDEYQELLGQGHDLIDGAMEIIDTLSKTHDLYIVTNGVTKTQRSRLKASGIDQYMKDVFISEETGFQKPMREYFDYCFARIPDICQERTLIVGDSLSSDILGGNNAGIDTCWFNPFHLSCDLDVKINYEIKKLSELLHIVN
ncbi:YjjG family noncanonical pyrimidine nucleotidase [Candidatus Galacturonibacter soehngenii]|uniref:Noncanonical pyrimidine nucleotidase, YjjG family n=1 Tax=Candidatus Galacturonatibacter soehngenii TaxID=2307010 RepID=A0A7V7QN78_9FIRM|nr:YjjG family noncanonical pyrimidine nucleotidase [Candidatus Galacturonibacter soehngenii]KAB1440411.1 noncanonical pyrimidine nucleotidase, YjjG family [Candidatus Galacturonibacter soehngenii]MBA4688933.1 noncanonical pyrimidine nucleotidase, YjjG family [Candidatus Galacturonibacter soehngenii]